MSTNKPIDFTTPVGRLVGGSVSAGRTTDYDGKPLVVKTGANIGQPRVDYSFGVAFQKTPGVGHWGNEPGFLQALYQLGAAAFPGGEFQRPDFAWKITDGDSMVPNRRGKKPAENEGYAGHWVVWFSSSTAPRCYNANGTQAIDPATIKCGYYVQVFGNAIDNKPSASPGLYINHSMVALAGIGPEIVIGPDVSQAGFGAAALPAGATAYTGQPIAPPAGVPAGAVAAPPNLPPVGSAPTAPVPAPIVAAPALPPVTPDPSIMAIPAPVPVPPAPPAPGRQMTAKAGGATYEQLIAAGWNDALLVQHGMMTQ